MRSQVRVPPRPQKPVHPATRPGQSPTCEVSGTTNRTPAYQIVPTGDHTDEHQSLPGNRRIHPGQASRRLLRPHRRSSSPGTHPTAARIVPFGEKAGLMIPFPRCNVHSAHYPWCVSTPTMGTGSRRIHPPQRTRGRAESAAAWFRCRPRPPTTSPVLLHLLKFPNNPYTIEPPLRKTRA